MAELPYSASQTLGILTGDDTQVQDAILNPVTNTEQFGSTLGRLSAGGLENVTNLFGNVIDTLIRQYDSDVMQHYIDIRDNDNLSYMEKANLMVRTPFAGNSANPIDLLLGEGTVADVANNAREYSKSLDKKNELARQYGGGGLGDFAAEAVAFLPVAPIGAMGRTSKAIELGVDKLGLAKSIGFDALENAGKMGLAEAGLGKFYGKTDSEAIADGIAAAAIGLIGTPALAIGGRGIAKLSESGEEAMAQAAGGGRPIKTTSGREVKSEGVEESRAGFEDVVFEVKDPRKDLGLPIEGQKKVPDVSEPKRFKVKYDDRGRVYTEDGSLLSVQGTAPQKASLKIKEGAKPTKEMKQAEREIKDRYGKGEASLSKSERSIDETIEVPTNVSKKSMKSRDVSLREDFINEQNAKTYTPSKTKSEEETYNVIQAKTDVSRRDAIKSIQNVTKRERLEGRNFDVNDITDQQRKKYRDDIGRIEDYIGARYDLKDYNSGKLTSDELVYRETRRISDKIERAGQTEFKSIEDAKAFQKQLADEYEEIGITVKSDDIDISNVKEPKKTDLVGKKESQDELKARELEEQKSASTTNRFIRKALKAYRSNGTIARYTRGSKSGQPILSKRQMKDVDDDILTDAEIANKTIPVSTKAGRKEAKEEATLLANKKVTEARAKKLGIEKFKAETKHLLDFEDTVVDASNSVMQVTAVLLGSKRIGKLAKVAGENIDVRDVIAKKMSDKLGYEVNKDMVKPTFMTENYGQGEKGLIKNIQKNQRLTKPEATAQYQAYKEASDDLIPEMVKLREIVYKQMENKDDVTFKWSLPDGFKVEFKLIKKLDGTISMRGKDIPIKVETDNLEDMSRALMPNIIHSVDAYIAREMNKRGIPTVHDAFVVPKGKEKIASDAYTEILQSINNSNLLDDIMRSIGYTGKSLKVGDLDSSIIAKSENKLGVEHQKGKEEFAKQRELDVSKDSTEEEIMRDYMALENVRETPTPQLIDALVNEAMYRTMSIAREGDDVFERQVALAHQSKDYQPDLAIPVPDGVNESVWKTTQENIFNEARAKIEFNPRLNKVLEGQQRKYFNEDGSLVGNNTNDVINYVKSSTDIASDILKTIPRPIEKDLTRKFKSASDAVIEGKIDVVKLRKSVNEFKDDRVLDKDEAIAKALDDELINASNKVSNKYKVLWDEQTSSSPVYDEFNKLESVRNIHKADTDRKTEILFDDLNKIPKDKANEIKKLVDSDYEAIRGMTKKQADSIWRQSAELYKIAGREIDAMARGIGKKSEQYGYYLNNPHLVAVRYNLPQSAEKRIDQLVSIRAMNMNNAWGIAEKYAKDKDTNFVLDVMAQKRQLSEDVLFADNPEKIVKGFQSEVFRGSKRINEKGKVVWDAESKNDSGVIGRELENRKVGVKFESQNKGEIPAFDNLQDELTWMNKNRIKKGHDGYRVIAKEDIRLEAGKTDDLATTLSETIRSVSQKVKDRGMIYRVLEELARDKSNLFSNTKKPGMIELTTEQKNRIPYELRAELNYVNAELVNKLLGRNEPRLYNGDNQALKVADRVLNNFGTMFKQNVVLKNPSSYINSFLYNQALALSHGISPNNMYRLQKEAMRDIKEVEDALKDMTRSQLTGKKRDKELENKLKNNLFWKMERAGLSTNRVEGVVGDDDLVSAWLKEKTEQGGIPGVFKVGQFLNLNQKTELGRATMKIFSRIDSMGRYTVAKNAIENGASLKQAVIDANGFYGNMDKMAPEAIEILDKYGFVPFLKWFSLVTPKLVQYTKNNPIKMFALSVGLYMFGDYTDTNVAPFSPVQGMIDFAEGSTIGRLGDLQRDGFFDSISNRASSHVIPNYIASYSRDPIDALYRDVRKPALPEQYKGITEQIFDGKD